MSALAFIGSDSNQDEEVIIRFYGNSVGLLYETDPINIPSKSAGINALANYETNSANIPAGELLSFRVEGNDSKLTILGSNVASQLKVTRKNL